jgi:hypothetical protein
MSPGKGQENGQTTADERKRIESSRSHAKALRKTNEPKRSGSDSAREHAPDQTLAEHLSQKGAAGLISRQRGRQSNNRLSEDIKKRALNLLKTKYQGFGPTLAHEKLVEKEKLKLSDESVRQLMIAEDLWKPRKRSTNHK